MAVTHPYFIARNNPKEDQQQVCERFKRAVAFWYDTHNVPEADRVLHYYDYCLQRYLGYPWLVLYPFCYRVMATDYETVLIQARANVDKVTVVDIDIDECYLGELE